MSFSMASKFDDGNASRNRRDVTLLRKITGDFSAAIASATLISPVITAIDRLVTKVFKHFFSLHI